MGNDPAALIEAWFAEHDGDGEFQKPSPAVAFSVIVPSSSAGRIVYTTKPRVVSTVIEQSEVPGELGMVGRYGLPGEADARWLSGMVGPGGLSFLGDMDPVDLMIFFWLRERLSPGRIGYSGLNDALLDALGIVSTDLVAIPLAPSERRAIAFLRGLFPDLRETVGPRCAQILEQGRKIELEVMLQSKHGLML
jgi:hypothetical protein